MKYRLRGKTYEIRFEKGRLAVTSDAGGTLECEAAIDGNVVRTSEGAIRFAAVPGRGGIWVTAGGITAFLESTDAGDEAPPSSEDDLRSPMSGEVVSVEVAAGDAVTKDRVLVVVTAMKMEYRIAAPRDGTVAEVLCKPKDRVDLGEVLVRLESAS